MAEQTKTEFPVAPDVRKLAEQSVEQARKAFDGFMSAAHGAVSTLESQTAAAQAGARDVQRQAVQFAEDNVAASFDLAKKLVAARDPSEMAQVHAAFVKAQIEALGEQARTLGRTAAKAAADTAKV
jgi:phasin